MLLAIDPGTTESAYVILDDELKPIEFKKTGNQDVLDMIYATVGDMWIDHFAIEMVASYGMAVGKEVFETCVWAGRFVEAAKHIPKMNRIYRKEEKSNLCGSMKAKDSNIIQALVDRFATGKPNHGKGTKKEKGWFYGFSKDVWQAYAVGVTYADLYLKGEQDGKSI